MSINCDNAFLTPEDIIGLLVHTDGTDEYINILDSGVDVGDLVDLDCDEAELTAEDLLRKLLTVSGGNYALRACIL